MRTGNFETLLEHNLADFTLEIDQQLMKLL